MYMNSNLENPRKPESESTSLFYFRPLRPYEKAYMFWYIEMLKPPDQRNPDILNAKYAFARGTTKSLHV